jgi:hypothetical protein
MVTNVMSTIFENRSKSFHAWSGYHANTVVNKVKPQKATSNAESGINGIDRRVFEKTSPINVGIAKI